jgi:hypothetical protein
MSRIQQARLAAAKMVVTMPCERESCIQDLCHHSGYPDDQPMTCVSRREDLERQWLRKWKKPPRHLLQTRHQNVRAVLHNLHDVLIVRYDGRIRQERQSDVISHLLLGHDCRNSVSTQSSATVD